LIDEFSDRVYLYTTRCRLSDGEITDDAEFQERIERAIGETSAEIKAAYDRIHDDCEGRVVEHGEGPIKEEPSWFQRGVSWIKRGYRGFRMSLPW
jgi:hypothetical protein